MSSLVFRFVSLTTMTISFCLVVLPNPSFSSVPRTFLKMPRSCHQTAIQLVCSRHFPRATDKCEQDALGPYKYTLTVAENGQDVIMCLTAHPDACISMHFCPALQVSP